MTATKIWSKSSRLSEAVKQVENLQFDRQRVRLLLDSSLQRVQVVL